MNRIYLDNNATTRPLPEVVDAVQQGLERCWANPSSIHRAGQEARQRVDRARESVAALVGAKTPDITFTSGGTEAANLAILAALRARAPRRLVVTSAVEHPAVGELLETLRSRADIEPLEIENDEDGVVSPDHLRQMLEERGEEVALVSIMWCNNETGVIEPIEELAGICHERGIPLHSDGTQWVGKMPVNVTEVPVDLLSFASHKFHGPKGVGALYSRPGFAPTPAVIGGPQERRRRGGTENVPGILGFGVAAQLAKDWLTEEHIAERMRIRDDFEQQLLDRIEGLYVHSASSPRAWTTSAVSFAELESELILLMLSERGVFASGGAACTSGALKESSAMDAMGRPGVGLWGRVRFSVDRETSPQVLSEAIPIVVEAVAHLRGVRSTLHSA
ncbi:MAG: cysteine desulfurase family protein [Phycisphaerales bacterium]|nr:cysteine desulfurase family protein [Phycisphaerales bacterium]